MALAGSPNAQARSLARDSRGAALPEFAIVAPTFLVLLFGAFDFGQGIYVQGILQSAVQDAGRDSGLESGADKLAAIDAAVKRRVAPVAPGFVLVSSRRNYHSFNDVHLPEDFADANDNGVYDPSECFTDKNGNGIWDADRGAGGQGGADDVVVYTAKLTYPRIVPLWKFLGWDPTNTVSATTILRNQPYSDQSVRAEGQLCPD